MNGHGNKWNLTSGDYNYYELSKEVTPGLVPNDPKHCLIPEIDKSYDKDLLIRISKFYTNESYIGKVIVVSGGTGSYAELNGEYYLENETATGANRRWLHTNTSTSNYYGDCKWVIFAVYAPEHDGYWGIWKFYDNNFKSVALVGPTITVKNGQPIGTWETDTDEFTDDITTLESNWKQNKTK